MNKVNACRDNDIAAFMSRDYTTGDYVNHSEADTYIRKSNDRLTASMLNRMQDLFIDHSKLYNDCKLSLNQKFNMFYYEYVSRYESLLHKDALYKCIQSTIDLLDNNDQVTSKTYMRQQLNEILETLTLIATDIYDEMHSFCNVVNATDCSIIKSAKRIIDTHYNVENVITCIN